MYWPDNAHTDGASPQILAVAKVWIDKLYTEAKGRGDAWIEPHITTDHDGDVMFEWCYGDKFLVVWVSGDGVEYSQSTEYIGHVGHGDVITEAERREAWQWFVS